MSRTWGCIYTCTCSWFSVSIRLPPQCTLASMDTTYHDAILNSTDLTSKVHTARSSLPLSARVTVTVRGNARVTSCSGADSFRLFRCFFCSSNSSQTDNHSGTSRRETCTHQCSTLYHWHFTTPQNRKGLVGGSIYRARDESLHCLD